ncbi:MAG: pyridoxamine 5'-phosphate oxidase family protein [Candidatus Paceibacterota bacterium]
MKCPETNEEWRAYLTELLDVSQYMTLATTGDNGPWINPVYFSFDKTFTFYFLSQPESRHMRNITTHAAVACAIFDPRQEAAGKVRGVQLAGKAQWVPSAEARHAFDTYFTATTARTPVPPRGGALAHVNETSDWRLAKVAADLIECFDEYCFFGTKGRVPSGLFHAQI